MRLTLHVDRTHDEPLVDQIREGLRRAIAGGELAPGGRLPSTRQVAQDLGVHRQTVVEAFRRLEADGLIEQRRGAGAFVRVPAAQPEPRRTPGDIASRALASYERRATRPRMPDAKPGALDLAGLSPHERDYPSQAFEDAMRRVLARRGSAALGYGAPAGDPELRDVLAARLRARGLDVEPSGLLVVGGAQQGLDLLFRALLDPGDTVLTEAPTYHLCLDLLAFHQSRVTPVAVQRRGDAGLATLDLAALDAALDRDRPRLAYVMPTFQNPTGLTLDLASRRALAGRLRDAGVLFVEDDYEADMRHGGEPLPPLVSLPEAGSGVYLGTLSKALFPGLRVGWLAGDPGVLARVAQVRRVSDLSGPLVLQAVAAELLASGAHDEHVARVVADMRRRMGALIGALAPALPEGCAMTRPQGGHVFWLEAPAVSGWAIAEKAAARGVLVTPGEAFASDGLATPAVRVSIARIGEDDVEEAARRLARAVTDAVTEARGRASRRDMDSPVAV